MEPLESSSSSVLFAFEGINGDVYVEELSRKRDTYIQSSLRGSCTRVSKQQILNLRTCSEAIAFGNLIY